MKLCIPATRQAAICQRPVRGPGALSDISDKETPAPAYRVAWPGHCRGAACAGCHDSGSHRAGTDGSQAEDAPLLHLYPARRHHGSWTPKTVGRDFEFSQILKSFEPFRQSVNVISNLGHRNVAPATAEDTGGAENHSRAAAVFLTGAHPFKGDRAKVGASVDQMAAAVMGQDTPLPSIEMSIEPTTGACDLNFTCAYRNTLSYKNESLPLPMENDPQFLFERLFGDGTTDAQRRERRAQS
ncbi:MAG TPA: DUF1552 domain-containing protein, partial [Steroidobacteraceae bacterium]|nr:DUF1552 domain-containing protein [Steroidobacteraceae bacterium]